MNQKEPKKREVLSYKEFLEVSKDPFAKKNLADSSEKWGFHKIKPEQAYAFVGFQDAVFKHISKIDYPGKGATESGIAAEFGITA